MITTVSRTTAQIVGTSEATGTFTFNNVVDNDFGCYSIDTQISTNGFQFPANGISILYSGTYVITANVSFTAQSTGIRYVSIVAPGGLLPLQTTNITNVARSQVSSVSAVYSTSLSVSVVWRLFTNTVVQMRVWQTGGTAISTTTANATLGTVDASLSAALILQ